MEGALTLLRQIPKRNPDCRHYDMCLSDAARNHQLDLGCGTCELKDDHSYEMSELDKMGLLMLWSEITHQGIFDDARVITALRQFG